MLECRDLRDVCRKEEEKTGKFGPPTWEKFPHFPVFLLQTSLSHITITKYAHCTLGLVSEPIQLNHKRFTEIVYKLYMYSQKYGKVYKLYMYSQKYCKVYTAVGLVCAANQITDHRKTNGGLGCQQDLHSQRNSLYAFVYF